MICSLALDLSAHPKALRPIQMVKYLRVVVPLRCQAKLDVMEALAISPSAYVCNRFPFLSRCQLLFTHA